MSVNKSSIWGNPNQTQLFNWDWGCLGKATRWVIPLFNVWEFTHPTAGLVARLIKGAWQKCSAFLKQHKKLKYGASSYGGADYLVGCLMPNLVFQMLAVAQRLHVLD